MTSPDFRLSRPLSARGRKPLGTLSVWCRSLGCPKNRVATETLLGSLGAGIAECQDLRKADLVFINTCGFIEPAVKESIDAILEAVRDTEGLKRRPLVAVGGCVVGRYGITDLQQEIPEVDLWLATKDLPRWPDMLRQRLGLGACAPQGRLLSGCPSYAWLKVAEGCRHRCAFCTIPAIRGGLRSRPAGDIVAEARALLAAGVRELDLVAQDLTDYGQDLHPGQEGLPALVRELAGLDGLFWLRLLYLYPKGITKELLQTVKDAGPVLPYFDIPLQHSHPDVLKRMGRPFDADPERVCGMIREALPEAALRTTCIVGYPGETEAQFEHLCRFVEKTRFTHLGVFTYWPEEGSKAAELPDQLPQAVKDERRDALMALQQDISAQFLEGFRGQTLDVLVDEANPEWPGLHNGRVWFQAPEVDGVTYVSGPGSQPGAVVRADVEDSGDYDLTALAQEPAPGGEA